MTTWAILADVHGRVDRLARVLTDAAAQGADQILFLGDLGGTRPLDALNIVGADYVFGNWEASGLRGLSQPYRSQMARWPAQYHAGGFWAAHASPIWPDGLAIAGVVDYLRAGGLRWPDLFPSLFRSVEARWAASTALEATGVSLFFHGHTHIQEAWRSAPDNSLCRFTGTGVSMQDDPGRWLVGVGSVGDPKDGGGACYALYDADACHVTWRRV